MHEEGAILQTLAVKRGALLGRLAFGVGISAAWLYWASVRLPTVFPFLAAVFIPVMGYALYRLVYLLFTGTAVIITDRGMIDRTSGLGFVAWSQIRGGALRTNFGLQLLELDVVDSNSILARLPPLRRLLWRYYLGQGRALYVNASFIDGGADALTQIVSQRVPGVRIGRVA